MSTPLPKAESVKSRFTYPATAQVDQVDNYHGVEVADPYRWLEDTYSQETAQWVDAQNEITLGYLNSLPQREALLERLTALWDYPKYGAPFQEGGQYFFLKNDGLQNQSVLYAQTSLEAEPRVLLDPNTLSTDGTVALTNLGISRDGKHLAYALARAGSDWQEFHVRKVADCEDLTDHLQWAKFTGISWTKDSRGFFYSRFPQPEEGNELQNANRHHKVYYHQVGTAQEQDELVFEYSEEPEWLISAYVTEEGDYLILTLRKAGSKNRVYFTHLGDPENPQIHGEVVRLIDEFEASYSYIGHDGTTFYFETDWNAPKGQIIAIDINQPDRSRWRTVIPEAADTIEDVTLNGDRFIVRYLHNAYNSVRIFNLAGEYLNELALPGLGTVGGMSGKRSDGELFFTFTSFLCPPTVYRYHVASGGITALHESQAKFDATPYETQQVWYESKDGTRVPMFVTHRRDVKHDGSNPTYLYGYGGFKIALKPWFSPSLAVWLEQGGVLAVPNLRGGGEFGQEWYDAGTKERKQNVFDDFIAAAECLIEQKYTSPEKLAVAGGSNGGLLVGAVLNQRPDLFGVALPDVGVMDMLRFHKFTIGSAWTYDYGCSDDSEQFKALFAYSPLHNIKSGTRYPATLVMTGDHDDRVVPGHSFKYAATLQAAQAGDAPILIRIAKDAGHGFGKPTQKIIEQEADRWAFVLQNLI